MKFRNLRHFIVKYRKTSLLYDGYSVYINNKTHGYQYENRFYADTVATRVQRCCYIVFIDRFKKQPAYRFVKLDYARQQVTLLNVKQLSIRKAVIKYKPHLLVSFVVNEHATNPYDSDYGWIELLNGKSELYIFKKHNRIPNTTCTTNSIRLKIYLFNIARETKWNDVQFETFTF